MADRPAEGYSKQQKFRDSDTDTLVDPGDSVKRAVRTRPVGPGTVRGPDGTTIEVDGEISDGQYVQDRQLRALVAGTNRRLDRLLEAFSIYFNAAGVEFSPEILDESIHNQGDE